MSGLLVEDADNGSDVWQKIRHNQPLTIPNESLNSRSSIRKESARLAQSSGNEHMTESSA